MYHHHDHGPVETTATARGSRLADATVPKDNDAAVRLFGAGGYSRHIF
jgi:hypothetical protein